MRLPDEFKGLKGSSLFKKLNEHQTSIIDLKRRERKFADPVILPAVWSPKKVANKAYAYNNDEAAGELVRTIVANTYMWMDSHDDVHLNNLFARSLKMNRKLAPHLHDHVFELSARVGNPISYTEESVPWKDLGVDLAGDTMCLLLVSQVLKEYNSQIYGDYLKDRIDQHSVAMSYVGIQLAMNSEEYENAYKVWQQWINQIGNREQVIEQGYFFAVDEAKLYETSAVLLGSNPLTPTLGGDTSTSSKESTKEEPVEKLDVAALLKNFKLNY